MKNLLKAKKEIALAAVGVWLASCGSGVPAGGPTAVNYVQIERLARPAVNEGLVISNANLNLWNQIPPSADLSTTSSGSLNAVATEAIGTLTVVVNLAVNIWSYLTAGNNSNVTGASSLWSVPHFNQDTCASPYTNCSAKTLATVHALQFVPDVMRIDVSRQWSTPGDPDATGTLSGSGFTTANTADAHVGYISCVNATTGFGPDPKGPLLCGGRKIRDNTAAITLSYLTFGADFVAQVALGASNNFLSAGSPFATVAAQAQYIVNDGYKYNSHRSWPGTGFPYLPAPYTSK
jgi:hypothetical protein